MKQLTIFDTTFKTKSDDLGTLLARIQVYLRDNFGVTEDEGYDIAGKFAGLSGTTPLVFSGLEKCKQFLVTEQEIELF